MISKLTIYLQRPPWRGSGTRCER